VNPRKLSSESIAAHERKALSIFGEMTLASAIGGPADPVKSATTSQKSSASPAVSGLAKSGLADNFQSFLKLLTTQLQHQNPLSPLDTNQFTQQLVQFAGVEQQLKSNSELQTLVSLEQSGSATQALGFVGHRAVVDGSSAKLTKSQASWGFTAPKEGTATVDIASSTGQVAYHGSFHTSSGQQLFKWDGIGNDGVQWPDGSYQMTVTLDSGTGKPEALSTQVSGIVDSIDLSQTPPLLTINGQSFTISQVKSIAR
jgi:flagellar basal-body rod modification protein FlgD